MSEPTFDRSRIHQESLVAQTEMYLESALTREISSFVVMEKEYARLRENITDVLDTGEVEAAESIIAATETMSDIAASVYATLKMDFFSEVDLSKEPQFDLLIGLQERRNIQVEKVARMPNKEFFEEIDSLLLDIREFLPAMQEVFNQIRMEKEWANKERVFLKMYREVYFQLFVFDNLAAKMKKWLENKPRFEE